MADLGPLGALPRGLFGSLGPLRPPQDLQTSILIDSSPIWIDLGAISELFCRVNHSHLIFKPGDF